MTQITDNAEGKFELWFFRDMNEAQRLKLFSLFGLPTDEIRTLGAQKLVLRRILSALVSSPGKDGGQEEADYEAIMKDALVAADAEYAIGPDETAFKRAIEAAVNWSFMALSSPQPASTALVERLTKALEPFAQAADDIERTYGNDLPEWQIQFPQLPMSDFRRARSALSASQSTSPRRQP